MTEETFMAELPKHAKVVVIGQGGIVGASVVHHLIEEGWDDIVGLEKSAIPTDIGSTSHASDFCYMTTHDKLNVFTSTYSREFYKKRGNYIEIGGMEVARKGRRRAHARTHSQSGIRQSLWYERTHDLGSRSQREVPTA
jgi:glycine/D-amino acid oxidase-like deaminating enzyme